LRHMLLQIALGGGQDRKITSAASYAVSKIASADFPEDWPDLLPAVIQVVKTGSDDQLHGALKVLRDLVDECFNDTQFFNVARDLVKAVYDVAVDETKRPILRALSVDVFRACFDVLEMVMEEHKTAVKTFADEALDTWKPFFINVLKSKLPEPPTEEEEEHRTGTAEVYRGFVALKLQVVKVRWQIWVTDGQMLMLTGTHENPLCVPIEPFTPESCSISGNMGRAIEPPDCIPQTIH